MDPSYRSLRATGLRLLGDPGLQAHPRLPFAGLEGVLRFFDLLPAPVLLPALTIERLPEVTPAFKNLDADTLLVLRQCLYTGQHLDLATRWAEALLRFCEVRLNSLQERAIRKWGTLAAARLHMLELGVFLLDVSLAQQDWRLLNTALKLSGQLWLFPPWPVSAFLPRLAVAWQWRIRLVSTYLLTQMERQDG